MASSNAYGFSSAAAWREAAMARSTTIDLVEAERRQAQASEHNDRHEIADPDVLTDQQLYIQGKMDMEEYQAYLLFKHGAVA